MAKMRLGKVVGITIAVGVVLLMGAHLTRSDGSDLGLRPGAAVAGYWLSIPMVALVVVLASSNARRIQQANAVLSYYFLFMLFWVFAKPSGDVSGGQHFHVIVVPIIMLLLVPVVLYVQWCVWRFLDWKAARKKHGEAPIGN